MRVLVACEESQRVAIAFRERGHEAYSCDILECSGGHPEWHIQGDVLPLINGNCLFTTMDGVLHRVDGRWDLLIAHPPCTYLTNASAVRMRVNGVINQERYEKAMKAKEFFMAFYNADCDHIVIENPVPLKLVELPPYTQIIQPYEHGEPYSKRTCLWLKNVPPSYLRKLSRNTSLTLMGDAKMRTATTEDFRVEKKETRESEVRHSPESLGLLLSSGEIWTILNTLFREE